MEDEDRSGGTGQRLCEDIYAMFDSFTTSEWFKKKNIISPYYHKITVYLYLDQSVMLCLHRNYLKGLHAVKC